MFKIPLPAAVLSPIFGLIGTVQQHMHPQPLHITVRHKGETFNVDTSSNLREVIVTHIPSGTARQDKTEELQRVRVELAALDPAANSNWPEAHPDADRKAAGKKAAQRQAKTLKAREAALTEELAALEGPQAYRLDFHAAAEEGRFSIGAVKIDVSDIAQEAISEALIEALKLAGEMAQASVKTEDVARAAHEANRAYCASIGDTSQVPWAEAPEWQRESAMAGVMAYLANPNLTPAETHAKWMEHKAAEGWVYGETKDAEAKTHPCMVAYEELPPNQQAKDGIFRAVVTSMLPCLQATVDLIQKVKEATPEPGEVLRKVRRGKAAEGASK